VGGATDHRKFADFSLHCYSITLSDKKPPENQLARAMDATGASRAIAIHNAWEWTLEKTKGLNFELHI
jgi:hypothetical protein